MDSTCENSSAYQRGLPRQLFFQDGPALGNQFIEDNALVEYLQRIMPASIYDEVEPDLKRFGNRVVTDVLQMAHTAEENPPKIRHFDAWGRRIDKIETSEAWKKLHGVSAEEGLVAIGYERKVDEFSRLYQFSKLYLFTSSSAIYSCPLAMTDGAARLTEILLHAMSHEPGVEKKERKMQLLKGIFDHLTMRDVKDFWTSGQWMTERTGGSDISNTETLAFKQPDGTYALEGFKWFTSATEAEVTFTLARIVDINNGQVIKGSPGLSLFVVKLRDEDGKLNNLQIHRLKDKLGTKALPTAEISLQGTKAELVSPVGKGVATIANLINITRVYNAISSVSLMRRIVALVRDYSHRRRVFGKKAAEQPLHLHTMAKMEVELRACLYFALECTYLLGRTECNKGTAAERDLLRLLIPIVKLYTAKKAISTISEGLECMGGAGYIEDTRIPRLLRDAQVLSIWEGTTNVLSLDVFRALQRHPKSFQALIQAVQRKLSATPAGAPASMLSILADSTARITHALTELQQYLAKCMSSEKEFAEAGAREFAFYIGDVYSAACLYEHACWSYGQQQQKQQQQQQQQQQQSNSNPSAAGNAQYKDFYILQRFVEDRLFTNKSDQQARRLCHADREYREIDRIIALDLCKKTGAPTGCGDRNPIDGHLRSKY